MSKIEWTNETLNPIHLVQLNGGNGGHWCQKISEGCTHCYAEEMNQSDYFGFASKLKYSGQVPDGLTLDLKVLNQLKRARKPRRIFVGSMTDLFGDWVPLDWQLQILDAALESVCTVKLLTKRPANLLKTVESWLQLRRLSKVPASLWLGTTVENQRCADERIPILQQIPAAVRFLSCEPLLESVQLNLDRIHWVIVGGESGSQARPCEIAWIENVVEQCQSSQVPLFVKQLGGRNGKQGDPEQWPEQIRFREFPDTLK